MRYAIMFNADSKTLTVVDEGADSTSSAVEGTKKSVGTLVYAEYGEIPTAQSHPQPQQHLENVARRLALDPREVTVKNDTGNDRLDFINKEGVELPQGTSTTDNLAAASAVADAMTDPSEFVTHEEEMEQEAAFIAETAEKPQTAAQKKAAEKKAAEDKEKADA